MKECPQVSVFHDKMVSLENNAKRKKALAILRKRTSNKFEVRFILRFFIMRGRANRKTNEGGRVNRGEGAKSEP